MMLRMLLAPPPRVLLRRCRPRRAARVAACSRQASAAAEAALGGAAWLAAAAPAAAAYAPAVDASGVADVAGNVGGVLFTVAFSTFLLRVLRRRASRATEVREAAARAEVLPSAPPEPVTAANCFLGAALATGCAALFWAGTQALEGAFDAVPASDQYAVRNVSATLRSIVTGLAYLATFLFAANAVGLTGLGLQTLAQGGEERGEG